MEAKRLARYDEFRARMNVNLRYPLPEKLGDARFIAFSDEGQPLRLKPEKPSILTRMITLNFKPILDIPFKKELKPVISARKHRPGFD